MKCKICHQNETDNTSGICWECMNKENVFRIVKNKWNLKDIEEVIKSGDNLTFSAKVLKDVFNQVREETKKEIMRKIEKSGYIVGRREGSAFKECPWEEIIKKI